jgi:hypothetical protein
VFRKKAGMIEQACKDAGFTVTINAVKPRKGAFVITIEGQGKGPLVNLLDLPRPFTKLRNLDMDQVIADILA